MPFVPLPSSAGGMAYRMQLFLYAKAAGNHAIQTPNCWAGVDVKP
jgi:hypothetical protein